MRIKNRLTLSILGAATALPFVQSSAFAQIGEVSKTLDTITVTATKRDETIQDVSMTLETIGAGELDSRGIGQISEMSSKLPGVHIGQEGIDLEIAIRGVGNRGANPAVALHNDGVNTSNSISPLFDVERVEVVYGPAGILYGRNSTAGAINVINKRPHNELELEGRAAAGNYNSTELDLVGNFPLTDTISTRFSLNVSERDGFNINTFGDVNEPGGADKDVISGRAQVFWDVTESLDVLVRYARTEIGGNGSGGVGSVDFEVTNGTNIIAPSANSLAGLTGYQVSQNTENPRAFPYFNLGKTNVEEESLTAEINWMLNPSVEATYIGGYTKFDGSGSVAPQIDALSELNTITENSSKELVHELRFSSATEGEAKTLDWMLGGFYYDYTRDTEVSNLVPAFGLEAFIYSPGNETLSYAVFANGSYNFTDEFSLSAGARQNWDERTDVSGVDVFAGGVLLEFFRVPLVAVETDFKNTDWRLQSDWEWAPDKRLYATVSTGYKSGGANQAVSAPTPEFEPEKVISYEVGSKNTLLDGRLILNAAAFVYDFTDYQLVSVNPNNLFDKYTQNVDGVKISGVDLSSAYTVGNLTLTGSMEYLDAKFEDGVSVVGPFGNEFDLTGLRPNKAPEFSASFNANYVYNIPKLRGDIRGVLDVYWTDDVGFSVVPILDLNGQRSDIQDQYALLDASLLYEHDSGRFALEAFVNNITNEDVIQGYNSIQSGFPTLTFDAPRTFGMRLTIRN